MRKTISTVLTALVLSIVLYGCEKGTTVTRVEPSTGNISGGDAVIIHGTNLKTGMTVAFGKQECSSITVESNTRIRVKTPSGPEGFVDVLVTDENGKTFLIKDGFRYHSARK